MSVICPYPKPIAIIPEVYIGRAVQHPLMPPPGGPPGGV